MPDKKFQDAIESLAEKMPMKFETIEPEISFFKKSYQVKRGARGATINISIDEDAPEETVCTVVEP